MPLRASIPCPAPRFLLVMSIDILPSGFLFEALLRIFPIRIDAAEFCIGICRKHIWRRPNDGAFGGNLLPRIFCP